MAHLWTRLVDAPFARVNHQCVCLNDSIYVFGGHSKDFHNLDLDLQDLDVFKWHINERKWTQIRFLKNNFQWDGSKKALVKTADSRNVPSLRYGHSVVAWRGRAWLYGGRSHLQECSNDIYMFCPASNPRCLTNGHMFPIWAKCVNLTGDFPIGSDGHSAAVVHDCMFIFGGFSEMSEGFTNSLYCLDFHTWHWTCIQFVNSVRVVYPPEIILSDSENIFVVSNDQWRRSHSAQAELANGRPPVSNVPLPREFASLISLNGRLFLFGGRSHYPNSHIRDIYDSILWELLPARVVHEPECSPGPPDLAECLRYRKLIEENPPIEEAILWEENTGNWRTSTAWFSTPRRPCCMHWHRNPRTATLDGHFRHDNANPWASGFACWRPLHVGHGLKTDNVLMDLVSLHLASSNSEIRKPPSLQEILRANYGNVDFLTGAEKLDPSLLAKCPLGRRSLSSWAYQDKLFIGFGLLVFSTVIKAGLHFNDLWSFDLSSGQWSILRNHCRGDHAIICPGEACSSLQERNIVHSIPLPRRRGSACLHYRPEMLDLERPQVFLFGGAHPKLYGRRFRTGANLKPPARPPMSLFQGKFDYHQVHLLSLNSSLLACKAPIPDSSSPEYEISAWLVQQDNNFNLVVIVPALAQQQFSLREINISSMSALSVFISQPQQETSLLRPGQTAWLAVLHLGQKSEILMEQLQRQDGVFNLILICNDLPQQRHGGGVQCIRRQFHPQLLPAHIFPYETLLQDQVCMLLPRVIMSLMQPREHSVPVRATLGGKFDWTACRRFLPWVLKSTLELTWMESHDFTVSTQRTGKGLAMMDQHAGSEIAASSHNLTATRRTPEGSNSHYVLWNNEETWSNSSRTSSRSTSPTVSSLTGSDEDVGAYTSSGPGVVERIFSLDHRVYPVSKDVFVLPHFGAVTIDDSSSLVDSNEFYQLQLEPTLRDRCLRLLQALVQRNHPAVQNYAQKLPAKMIHNLSQINEEQFDWRWSMRTSTDG